ncbi:MAG: hypothetical protein ABSB75_00240, partial [Candidatus Limnocylindrales bacterium]
MIESGDHTEPASRYEVVALRRDAEQPDRWRLLTQLRNYGNEKVDVTLAFSVNGQPIGQRDGGAFQK